VRTGSDMKITSLVRLCAVTVMVSPFLDKKPDLTGLLNTSSYPNQMTFWNCCITPQTRHIIEYSAKICDANCNTSLNGKPTDSYIESEMELCSTFGRYLSQLEVNS